MAGYSATPLVSKLGIAPGDRVRFVGAPAGYAELLGTLPENVRVLRATRGTLDFIQAFARTRADLERVLPALVAALAEDGKLWISWPKGTSPLARDLAREGVREIGLATGLVDIKVCAVDDDWSALKFVFRRASRSR